MKKLGVILVSILFTSVGVMSNTLADPSQAKSGQAIIVAKVDWVYDFFLCQSDHTGKAQIYSCRQYEKNNRAYRLYYRGGDTPKAVAIVSGRMPNESFQFLNPKTLALPVHRITPPDGVPNTAKFLGTGVCLNNADEKLPCGVFEHRPARDPNIYRYMVFYHYLGGGPIEVIKQVAGQSPDAMSAEIFYQMGLQLLKANCCYTEGVAYLEQAKILFPDSKLYWTTYNQYKIGPSRTVADSLNRNRNTIREASN